MTDKIVIIPNQSTGEIGLVLSDGGHSSLTRDEALELVAKIVTALAEMSKADAV